MTRQEIVYQIFCKFYKSNPNLDKWKNHINDNLVANLLYWDDKSISEIESASWGIVKDSGTLQ